MLTTTAFSTASSSTLSGAMLVLIKKNFFRENNS
jgi:hypothetical protein